MILLNKIGLACIYFAIFFEGFNAIVIFKGIHIGDVFIYLSFFALIHIKILSKNKKFFLKKINTPLLYSFFLLVLPYIINLINVESAKENSLAMAKTVLSIYILPFIFIFNVQKISQLITIIKLFLISNSINSIFAVLEKCGLNLVQKYNLESIAGGYDLLGRSEGLSMHPTMLGALCAMSIPLLYINFKTEREIIIKSIALILLVIGLILSGSRSSIYAAVLVNVIYLSFYRIKLLIGLLFIFTASFTLFTSNSYFLESSDKGNQIYFQRVIPVNSIDHTASDSNNERYQLLQNSIDNIYNNLFFGDGMKWIQNAHSIFIQFFESGGIFGLGALLIYFVYLLYPSYKIFSKRDALGIPIVLSFITFVIIDCVSNFVYTRPILIPLYILIIFINLNNPYKIEKCDANKIRHIIY